jgi:hypothetical protein
VGADLASEYRPCRNSETQSTYGSPFYRCSGEAEDAVLVVAKG